MLADNKHTTNAPRLGEGIFLISDVSKILRLPYHKVRYWLLEFWDEGFGKKTGGYSFGEKDNKAVNFYTLLEFYTFYELRKKGLSAQKIRKYHDQISKEFNTPYPFASNISTDGKKIWYHKFQELVSVDGKKQIAFEKILSPFLHKIEFDKNHLAERYFPLGKKHKVVVDPKNQFGQPTIEGTNIKIETIRQLLKGGESKKSIILLYDLTIKQINDSILYYKNVA